MTADGLPSRNQGDIEPIAVVSLRGAARGLVTAAVRVACPAAIAGVAGTALWVTVRSLHWPLVHDAPLMHYVAARILDGAVPYRDLFDMNFPGVYLAHLLALVLLGGGDGGFRVFDLALLGATLAGLALALRPFGPVAITAATALFWLFHVAGGAWRAGQRDLILCAPLAWMAAAAVAYAGHPRPRTLGLAGLWLGVAVWVKPHALLLGPALVWLAWIGPPGVTRARTLGVLALGLAAPAVPILGWLAATGGLGAFLDIVGGYLVPLYSRVGRVPLLPTLAGWDVGPSLLVAAGLWTLGGVVAIGRAGATDHRLLILGAGVVYGVLHFVAQGKGWAYHLYPLALFAVALGAAGLGAAVAARRPVAAAVLVTALVLIGADLRAKGTLNLDSSWIAESRARAHAAAAALRPLVAQGGTVQVLDTTAGGIHALYLLRARQPTRFLYDFPFYHDVDTPYIRRLRAELLEGLRAAPPAAVVLFAHGWPSGGYERLAAFPDLARWLESEYRLSVQGEGYRVYENRRVGGGHPRPGALGGSDPGRPPASGYSPASLGGSRRDHAPRRASMKADAFATTLGFRGF